MGIDERYHLAVSIVGVDSPFRVYDATGQCHIPLTAFGRALAAAGQPATARSYAYALLPYFAFLDTDPVQRAAGRRWDSLASEIHAVVRAYLSRCPEKRTLFLAALRRFYRVQHALGAYPHPAPPTNDGGPRTTTSPIRTCTPVSCSPVAGLAGVCASAAWRGSRSRRPWAWRWSWV